MEQTKLENQEQDRKFPVSHMISGYEPKKSLEIIFADANDKENYRVKLDAEHNLREGPVEKCCDEYDVYKKPGKVITQEDMYNLSHHVAHYDNEKVGGMGDPSDVYAVIVDGKRVFDREKENAKYLAVSVNQENDKVKDLTVVDLSGKPLLDKTYDGKSTVAEDKKALDKLFKEAKYITGFDMSQDIKVLKANGIDMPTGRKYFDMKENHEYLQGMKYTGKDKAEKWKAINKGNNDAIEFGKTTKSQARAIIGDFSQTARVEMGVSIPKDREQAVLKKLDKVLSQAKENVPKKKGIHRKESSQQLER